MRRSSLALALLFLVAACASSPQLYPNSHYKQVGKDVAEQDIKSCEDDSEKFLKSAKGKQMLEGAGTGAVVGAATGGVLGIFTRNILGGALIGAAVGTAAGAASGAMKPDQVKRKYVDKCLHDKGYEVLGWD